MYSLLWCKFALGWIDFILGPDHRWELRHQADKSTFGFLSPLLQSQAWIDRVSFSPTLVPNVICLNDFRKTWFGKRRSHNLFESYAEHFHTDPLPEDIPWLEAEPKPIQGKPVVISRSTRYRNRQFPWNLVAYRYSGRMAFVGLREEYMEWNSVYRNAAIYHPVSDALELAQIIAGSRLFIGNQSFPMSLALALNVQLIQEVGHPNADCRFKRSNAFYYETGSLALPFVK